jgi:DNA-binding MarR family transcriptional regulator
LNEARSASPPPASGDDAATAIRLGVLQDLIGFHLAQATVSSTAMFQRAIAEPHGLRKVEFSLLMLVLNNGPLSPKQLAQVLSLSAPNLTMLIDRMQARGLLARVPNPADKRSQHIVLTEAGLDMSQRAMAAAPAMERELGDRLSSAERAMLIELLGKVAGRG